jgi:hypothetical protein
MVGMVIKEIWEGTINANTNAIPDPFNKIKINEI